MSDASAVHDSSAPVASDSPASPSPAVAQETSSPSSPAPITSSMTFETVGSDHPEAAVADASASADATAEDVAQANGESSGGSGIEANGDSELTLRALVSTKEAGVIIGKAGKNVAELRELTGVKAGVSKVVPGVHDRVLSVTGTLDGVAKAYAIIAQTLLDNPVTSSAAATIGPDGTRSTANAVTSLRLLISHNLMGTIIGRQGLKIKFIQDVSGARMVASKEMLPQSTERVVEVQGIVDSLRVAVWEIGKCLVEDWERGVGTVLYNPAVRLSTAAATAVANGGAPTTPSATSQGFPLSSPLSATAPGPLGSPVLMNYPNSAGGRGIGRSGNGAADFGRAGSIGGGIYDPALAAAAAAGGYDPEREAYLAQTAANVRTQQISIPADMVGCIIGKSGGKIAEIRRLSGSRISIAKVPHDDSGERMFTITGTPESNEKALYLLYNQLEIEKERRVHAGNVAAAAASSPTPGTPTAPTTEEGAAVAAAPAPSAE